MKFYTNVFVYKNIVHHYYVDENGKRKTERVRFKPTLGVKAGHVTGYRDIYGQDVGLVPFDSIRDMYQWRKENEDRGDIFGDVMPQYQFIAREYPGEVKPDFTRVRIHNLDIEVQSNEGFPFPEQANHEITAITVQDMAENKYVVFGCQPYTPKTENVTYILCDNEEQLLDRYIDFTRSERPDILTGWNIDGFDIPYLINRAKKILPKDRWLDLSPVKVIEQRRDKWTGENSGYGIKGVAAVDYMRMYKTPKFQPESRESYALNFVCQFELGEAKVDYMKEFKSLSDLYENNYEKFIDYNIRDVELVYMLNLKLKFLELIQTMAYMAKVNVEDAFGSVKIWEIFVYNELKAKNMVMSPRQKHPYKKEFPGGFVKEPVPGMKKWLTVWDITSSYPNQIISFNLSPEKIINFEELPGDLKEIRERMQDIDGYVDLADVAEIAPVLKKHDVTMAANGEFFRRDGFGVFPEMVERVFLERKARKKEAGNLYRELQGLKDELKELENE